MNRRRASEAARAETVLKLMNRSVELDALGALAHAMGSETESIELPDTVIAFDANVFLRLSGHPRSEDIVDFLGTGHENALILPGQVVQEFWNNQYLAVDSLAESIKKKHTALKAELEKIDSGFGEYADRFDALMTEFQTSYGYVFDENTVRRTSIFVSLLQEKAMVPYVPREIFRLLADVRRRTKTPPGFKDEGDGDFFVWADLLMGLSRLQDDGKTFKHVALVTKDRKMDWCRNGRPHPILAAELKALTGASFVIWDLDVLASKLLDS